MAVLPMFMLSVLISSGVGIELPVGLKIRGDMAQMPMDAGSSPFQPQPVTSDLRQILPSPSSPPPLQKQPMDAGEPRSNLQPTISDIQENNRPPPSAFNTINKLNPNSNPAKPIGLSPYPALSPSGSSTSENAKILGSFSDSSDSSFLAFLHDMQLSNPQESSFFPIDDYALDAFYGGRDLTKTAKKEDPLDTLSDLVFNHLLEAGEIRPRDFILGDIHEDNGQKVYKFTHYDY